MSESKWTGNSSGWLYHFEVAVFEGTFEPLVVGIFFGWGFEILALSYLGWTFLSKYTKIDVP